MNDFTSYPTLYATFPLCHPTGHSDDYRKLPRPVGSIAYVKSGHGYYETPDGDFTLTTGDILFVPKGGTYISHWETDVHILAFQFRISDNAFNGYRCLVQHWKACEEEYAIFQNMLSEGTSIGQKEVCFTEHILFYQLLERIWPKLRWTEQPKMLPQIVEAAAYLRNHHTEKLSIPELAQHFNMSSSYFYACFQSSMGVSPLEYQKRYRVTLAQQLLSEYPNLTIGEISDQLGFSSESYFRRVFSSVTGISPREYRKQGGGI